MQQQLQGQLLRHSAGGAFERGVEAEREPQGEERSNAVEEWRGGGAEVSWLFLERPRRSGRHLLLVGAAVLRCQRRKGKDHSPMIHLSVPW